MWILLWLLGVSGRLTSSVYEPLFEAAVWSKDCSNTNGLLWPWPSSVTLGAKRRKVCEKFQFEGMEKVHTLTMAYRRYYKLIFPYSIEREGNWSACSAIQRLKVVVADLSEQPMQLDTDERYRLSIPESGDAMLRAQTIYGALRGLETFSQLVRFDFDTEEYSIAQIPWEINDVPRFPHRGVMIDTSRHFLPLTHIRQVIDAMTYAKLNVLHWHMVDDQAFPMQSKSHPALWKGAWSPHERYLQTDIRKLVEYARKRGVRVMIEIDMPGHGRCWCKGIPEICPSTTCLTPLNVANNKTFEVITYLLHEITGGKKRGGLFPDDFIHLGGDEVNLDCWNTTPAVKAWLDARNYTTDDGYKYFVDRVASIARSQGRRPIQWVEVFEHFGDKLDKNTIVHVWKDKEALAKVVKAGYHTLLSDYRQLYLDYLKTTWKTMYSDEPFERISNPKEQKLVLGGQTQMWGETVDSSDLHNTIWPRAAAYAERLWSPRNISNPTCAERRIKWFRCLLLSRGIAAAPVSNLLARRAPPHPGSCFI